MNQNCREGLIFISREDPLSSLISCVTKQTFTSVGFFYTTTSAGTNETKVILLDDNFIINGKGDNDLIISIGNLSDLTKDNSISKICFKDLRPVIKDCEVDITETKELKDLFRSSIAREINDAISHYSVNKVTNNDVFSESYLSRNLLSKIPLDGLKTEIKTFVKKQINDLFLGTNKLSLKLINKVIQDIDKSHLLRNSISIDEKKILDLQQKLSKDSNGKAKILSVIGKELKSKDPSCNQEIKNINSLYNDHMIFDEQTTLDNIRNEVDLESYRRQLCDRQRNGMSLICSCFAEMIFNDQVFLNTVVDGINQMKDVEMNSLKNKVNELEKRNSELVNYLTNSVKDGKLNTCELNDLISTSQKEVTSPGIIFVSDGHSKIEFSHNYEMIANQINNIRRKLEKSKEPVIHINKIIYGFNKISSILGQENRLKQVKGKYSYPALINVAKTKNIEDRRILSTGRKIILSSEKTDLDKLNTIELEEIKEILEHKKSDNFCEMLNKITTRLSTK